MRLYMVMLAMTLLMGLRNWRPTKYVRPRGRRFD